MDNFQLELYRTSIGTHITDKDKRKFLLSLYDTMIELLQSRDIYIIEFEKIILLAAKGYHDVEMPEYFKATIWVLEHRN